MLSTRRLVIAIALTAAVTGPALAQTETDAREAPPTPGWHSDASVGDPLSVAYTSADKLQAIVLTLDEAGKAEARYVMSEATQVPASIAALAFASMPNVALTVSSSDGEASVSEPVDVVAEAFSLVQFALPAVDPPQERPGALRFRAAGPAGASVAIVVRDGLLAIAPKRALPLLGPALAPRDHLLAVAAWGSLAELTSGTLDAARARLETARLQESAGQADQAADGYRKVLGLADELGGAHSSITTTSSYTRNRLLLDLAGDARRGLFRLSGEDASLDDLLLTADAMPPVPERAAACARAAAFLVEAGDEGPALVYALRVFDLAGDRGSAYRTRLPENQVYLDAVTAAIGADVIAQAAHALNSAVSELAPELALEAMSDDFVIAWASLEQAALGGDPAACRIAAEALSVQSPGKWPAAIAQMALGQRLCAHGAWPDAAATLRPVAENEGLPDAIRQLAQYSLGRAYEGAGLLREAERCYDLLLSEDPLLGAEARLRRAQCKELRGEWERAADKYAAIAEGGEWTAQRAAHGLKRIDAMRSETAWAEDASAVTYLGEDRQTRGDWHHYYGTEAFVLCGQQAPNDIHGGPVDLKCAPYTGTDERYRLWISKPEDPDPAMIWNPVQQVRRPANWDDRGEVYLLGTGPDLLLDLQVPAGPHRLSLYFVNDHTYYEPNREYTVYVLNQQAEVLAAASVRDFLNGVYEQFGVVGPQKLTIRICRDLSMNVLLSGVFLDAIEPPPAHPDVPGIRPDSATLAALRAAQGPRYLSALQELAKQSLDIAATEPASAGDAWVAW